MATWQEGSIRRILYKIVHLPPVIFHAGRIISMSPASRPAAALTGKPLHSSGSGVAIRILTYRPSDRFLLISFFTRVLVTLRGHIGIARNASLDCCWSGL